VTGTINTPDFGVTFIVSLGGASESFAYNSTTGVFTPKQGQLSRLSTVENGHRWELADGTVVMFSAIVYNWPLPSTAGAVTSITRPSGEKTLFHYRKAAGALPELRDRLQSVTNNRGYQLKFSYARDADPAVMDDYAEWKRVTKVAGVNNAVLHCAPAADACAGVPPDWPSVTYALTGDPAGSSSLSVTEPLGASTSRTTVYETTAGEISRIQRPTGVSTFVGYTNGRVSSISNGAGTPDLVVHLRQRWPPDHGHGD
jgi:hypothetical protein